VSADGLRLAVSLLTVLPVRAGRVDRRSAGWAMVLAPVAGMIVGGVAALVLLIGDLAGLGGLLPACLAVAAMALTTRGLHLDGLADVADGLGSGKPADGALAVMKRSDIGPFGVATLVLTLLVQVAALSRSAHPASAVVIAAMTGRLALTWACRTGVPPARPDVLGALVAGSIRPGWAALTTGLVLIAAALSSGALAPVAVLTGLAVAEAMRRHTARRFGGITGDVLGAVLELATTATLIVLAPLR
jgi:adenosylcobinamide-GDP ribazoletransferase